MVKNALIALALLAAAAAATTKYVDLSQVSDTTAADPPRYWHSGTSNDPFNHRNFRDWVGPDVSGTGKYYTGAGWITGINTSKDTFLIKGVHYAPEAQFTYNNPFIRCGDSMVFKPWDPHENGPYRIRNYYTNGYSLRGKWYGGIIKITSGSIVLDTLCRLYTMWFDVTNAFFLFKKSEMYGCFIYSGSTYVTDSTNRIVNTVFLTNSIEHCGTNFRLNAWNSLFNKTLAFWGSCGIAVQDTNNQFNWGSYLPVTWNAPKDSFNSTRIVVGVSIPPEPGKTPYTEHETDLWGNQRYGIGANLQKSPMVSWFNTVIDTFGKSVNHTANVISGPVDSFKAITTLPVGLSMNKATGAIEGTPSKVTLKKAYTFRAWGSDDSVTVVVYISIIPWGPKRHYVDLSQMSDNIYEYNTDSVKYQCTGEIDAPFNHRTWKEILSAPDSGGGRFYNGGVWHSANSDNDTFFIKGNINIIDSITKYGASCYYLKFLYHTKGGQVTLPWNPVLNGPYRIYWGQANYHGTWKGGYIYNPGNLYGTFYTMLLGGSYPIGGDSMTSMHFLDGMKLYGCTIECNEVWYHNDGTDTFPYIQDCIMRHRETSGPIPPKYLHFDTKNSAYAMSHLLMRNNGVWPDSGKIDDSLSCQWGDSTMIVPGWNAPKDSFKLSMALNGVLTPPQPGNAPYTGYETDLFGVKRKNIGANWQPSTSHIWEAGDSITNVLWSNNLNWSNWAVPDSMDTVILSSDGGSKSPGVTVPVSVGQITRTINFGTRDLFFLDNKIITNNGGILIYDNGSNGMVGLPDTIVLNGSNDSIRVDAGTIIPVAEKPYRLIINGAAGFVSIDNFFWSHVSIKSGSKLTCAAMDGIGGTTLAPDTLQGGTLDLTGNQTVTWADPVYVKDMALAAGDTVTLTAGIDGGGNTGAWIFPSSTTTRRNRGWLGLGVWIRP